MGTSSRLRAVAGQMLSAGAGTVAEGSSRDGTESDASLMASAAEIERHALRVIDALEAEGRAARANCVSVLPPGMGVMHGGSSDDVRAADGKGSAGRGRAAWGGVLRAVPSLRGSLARRWNRWLVATVAPDLIRLWRRCEEVVTHVDGNDAKRIASEAWHELMTSRAPSGADVPSRLAHHAAAMLMTDGHISSGGRATVSALHAARCLKQALWTGRFTGGTNSARQVHEPTAPLQCLYRSDVELCWPPDVVVRDQGIIRQAMRFVGLESAVDTAVQAANDLGGGEGTQPAGRHPLAQLFRKWGARVAEAAGVHSGTGDGDDGTGIGVPVSDDGDGLGDAEARALGMMQEGIADVMRQLQEQIERLLDMHCMAAYVDACWVPEWRCTSWEAQQLGRPIGAFAPNVDVIQGLQAATHRSAAETSISSSVTVPAAAADGSSRTGTSNDASM